MGNELDVVVIGSGPGGYTAAIRAAQLGRKVTVVEKAEAGGVCLNRGCIPSKSLISAAHRYQASHDFEASGIFFKDVEIDFTKVQRWKEGIVDKLTGGVRSLLKGNEVAFLQGEAVFTDKNEITVQQNDGTKERYTFRDCIIATGSRPVELKPFPFGGRILSSTEALELQEIPKSVVVIGGGYIGIELGQTFAKFGSEVTIIEGTKQILPLFEKETVRWVNRRLKKDGVNVITKAKAISSEQSDSDVTVRYAVGDEEASVTAQYLLVTVGRVPNTQGLGLEAIGVELDERGYIQVDKTCKTNVDGIYAIGDVVPGPALAHKASYEGKVAAEAMAGESVSVRYMAIPAIVFSDPEIASVGLNETEAKAKGVDIVTGKFNYGGNGRALSLDANEGFVKVIADRKTNVVLGGQIVGPNAPDLIAELALAVEKELTLSDIADTIHAHPTLGEMTAEAVENAMGQGIHTIMKR